MNLDTSGRLAHGPPQPRLGALGDGLEVRRDLGPQIVCCVAATLGRPDQLRKVSWFTPSSRATCRNGRSEERTNSTASLRNCSGYFDGRDTGTSLLRPLPGLRMSGSQGQPQAMAMAVADSVLANDPGGPEDLEQAAAVFAQLRPRLFGIAYRMPASTAEAEDLIQDVWLRWQTCDRSTVANPAAYLATATTRLAINATQSARVQREGHEWGSAPSGPRGGASGIRCLATTGEVLAQRTGGIHPPGSFDYPYRQIADILRSTEVAVRQLVSRARKHVVAERRAPVTGSEQRRLLTAFVTAARSGDLATLEEPSQQTWSATPTVAVSSRRLACR